MKELLERAISHACNFRDSVADRVPRPVIPAGELCALFDEIGRASCRERV